MLSVEDSAYKHRTKIQKGTWSLPNYAVFAQDEGVVNKFYFQLHTLRCFSRWLSSWAHLTQDPSLWFVPELLLCCQVPTALALLLNFTVRLCFCTQNRGLNAKNSVS